MSVRIDSAIPAGNIVVVSMKGNEIALGRELRDTDRYWFYWKFRAVFTTPGEYCFRFDGAAVGARGPAVSRDRGESWIWLGVGEEEDAFSYSFHEGEPAEVWFCMGIPYLQGELEKSGFKSTELCRSRKGRLVERIDIGDGPEKLLLCCRHHACEMMANYVLEGFLTAVSGDSDFKRRFHVTAVPFVDKDGVEEGDQGKGRMPYDHARDYGDAPIYPETRAIMELVRSGSYRYVLDLHCPWLRGDCNETLYFVGPESARQEENCLALGKILEKESPVPYFNSDMIRFGTSWNTPDNYVGGGGTTLSKWAEKRPGTRFAATLEIPYANAREFTLTPDAARGLGAALARSLYQFSG